MEPPSLSHLRLPDSTTAALEAVLAPVIELSVRVGMKPASPRSSYLGGFPYVPEDDGAWAWPLGEASGKPMAFLGQVSFEDFPNLPGFPRTGVLQWFIDGPDPSYQLGLSFEKGSTGREGLHLRWYPELTMAKYDSTESLPYESLPPPLLSPGPHLLVGRQTWCLPHPNTAYEAGLNDPLLSAYAYELDGLDETLVDSLPLPPGFALGGHPLLIQSDPRREGRERDLIMNLDSLEDVFSWGDWGTAQLFGDPTELLIGTTKSFWWDWACS